MRNKVTYLFQFQFQYIDIELPYLTIYSSTSIFLYPYPIAYPYPRSQSSHPGHPLQLNDYTGQREFTRSSHDTSADASRSDTGFVGRYRTMRTRTLRHEATGLEDQHQHSDSEHCTTHERERGRVHTEHRDAQSTHTKTARPYGRAPGVHSLAL